MADVQLNVWIEKHYKDQLERWKQEENKPGMNVIIEELIEAEIARRSGKVVEQQSLPVIREIIRSEIREATAQLRRDVRLDRELEQTALRDYLRKGFDRIAGLSVQSIRAASYAHYLSYTLLSKGYTPEFARRAYQDAREKIEQQLLPRKARNQSEPHES